MNDRMDKQIQFLVEADKMKNVFRQTLLVDKSRQETDAEHSWHFALMAMILYEYTDQSKVDLNRVLKMALVHDLIEVYAGDTFAYDDEGIATKSERESQAADKLFGMLPDDQGTEIRSLWEEFDSMETPDAQFAAAIDRLQPLISNYYTQGYTWNKAKISSDKVYKRMDIIRHAAPDLWKFAENIIEDSVEKGYIDR